jgi:hypothetical protein
MVKLSKLHGLIAFALLSLSAAVRADPVTLLLLSTSLAGMAARLSRRRCSSFLP